MASRRSFSAASRPTRNSSFCAPIQTTSSARHEITKLASCCQNSCRHLCVKSIASRSSLLIMFSLPPLTRGCLIDIGIEGHTASKLFYMKNHSEASPFAHFTSESLFAQTVNQMAEFSELALRVSCEQEFFLKYGYRNPTGFRRWVKVAKSGGLCYTCVMGTWKSKTDTSICYSIILFSYASIERNC